MAAGTMALSPFVTNTMHVSAKETTKNEYSNELENKVKDLEAAQALLDEAKAAYEEALAQYESAQTSLVEQEEVVSTQYTTLNEDIMTSLQPILDEIETLENQLEEKNQAVEEEQTKTDQASLDLEKAQNELESKKARLEELKGLLDGVNIDQLNASYAELESAQASQKKAQEDVDNKQAELDRINEMVSDAQNKLDASKNAYDEAVLSQQDAQSNYDLALEKVNYYDNENGVDLAKEELEQASIDLGLAKQETLNAQNDYDQANNEYSNALSSQKSAQTDYDGALQSLNEANVTLSSISSKVEDAQKEYDEASKKVEDKNTEISSISEQIVKMEKEVSEAQSAYDQALIDYNQASTPLEQAQKALSDFETKYKDEIESLAKGSLGYFESIGASIAVDTLKNPVTDRNSTIDPTEYASYTHIGEEGDATSLENLKRAISYIKECNDIRKKDGCTELDVSMYLMAVGELNANFGKENVGFHSMYFNTGENASWGENGDAGSEGSPFRGWYDEEKTYYDYIQQYISQNPNASDDEIVEAAKKDGVYPYTSSGSYGHYINVIRDYSLTGYGLTQTNTIYHGNHAQEFLYTAKSGDIVMSVDEFEKSLNTYCSKLETVQSQYSTLKQAVEDNKDKNTKDDRDVVNRLEILNQKKSQLNELNESLSDLKGSKSILESAVQSKQAILDGLKKDLKEAENDVSKKNGLKDQAEKALNTSKQEVNTKKRNVDMYDTLLTNTKKNEVLMEDKVENLKDTISHWQINKESAHEQLKESNEMLASSNDWVEQATKNLNEYSSALITLKEEQDTCKMAVNQSRAVLDEQNKMVQSYKSTQEKMNAYEESQKMSVDMQSLEKKISSLTNLKNESIDLVNKDRSAIEELISKLSVKRADKSVYVNYQSLLDNVLELGTKADLSSIDDVDVLVKFLHLAKDVDSLNEIQCQYDEFVRAKELLEQAQSEYDSLMNTIVERNESVNTAVSTDVLPNTLMIVATGAGMMALKKKRAMER